MKHIWTGTDYDSPRAGDRVRALTDEREPQLVEGVLYLRYHEDFEALEVGVVPDGTRLFNVDPYSIEVVARAEHAVGELKRIDGRRSNPDPRRIRTLADAYRLGLLEPVRNRDGGTWEDMLAACDRRIAPLTKAGWEVGQWETEESHEYGDSVFRSLCRRGQNIQVEYYESTYFVVYPDDPKPADWEGGPHEPILVLSRSRPYRMAAVYQRYGLI